MHNSSIEKIRSKEWVVSDSGFGIRDSGFGIRDSGFGIRDSGFGIRDSGFGIRDLFWDMKIIELIWRSMTIHANYYRSNHNSRFSILEFRISNF